MVTLAVNQLTLSLLLRQQSKSLATLHARAEPKIRIVCKHKLEGQTILTITFKRSHIARNMSIAEERESPEPENAAAQLCRVCNEESVECISLYKTHIIAGELTTLAAMLSDCANLQVLEEEHFLPRYMCYHCVEVLAQMYEFKRIALRTDVLLRKRYARTQRIKSSSHSRSQSPEKAEVQAGVKADTELETEPTIEITGTDEFVYVLEDTDALENIVSSPEDKDSVLEEIPEDQLHFASDEPHVHVFEVDYDMDLADEYDHDPAEEEEDEEEEEEKEQLNTIASRNIKVRAPQRRKSLNPALQCQVGSVLD